MDATNNETSQADATGKGIATLVRMEAQKKPGAVTIFFQQVNAPRLVTMKQPYSAGKRLGSDTQPLQRKSAKELEAAGSPGRFGCGHLWGFYS